MEAKTKAVTRVAALLIGATAVVAGCGSDSGSGAGSPHDVTVIGTGQVRGAPDTLNADLGVEVQAGDVSTAIDTANDKAKAVTDAMVAAGAKREDIQTAELSVQPQYGPDSQVIGYRATNTVRVVVRDLPKASSILSDAVKAGGNNARINNVSFALDDNSKLLADARARAFSDAKARAEQYAVLAGLKLKDVKTINETSSGTPPSPSAPRFNKSGAQDIPIEPGTETVKFDVTVTWNLG